MAFEGGIKRSRISATPPPPRTLNVQKFAESRAPEIESLHSIVASRLNNDFRSQRNKRRRTTGHDNRSSKNRWRKKQKSGFINNDEASALGKDQKKKKVPRRVLRRIELRSNPATGFCVSGDGTKRLRTHLWHAKRFTMTKRWGFYLPSRLQGRGRGSRALLRWFKRGVLVHDASYMFALQLEGPEDSLLSILRMVLVPTPSVRLEELSNSILSGVSYGSAMLHHVGIPSSQLIAPVTYMWRPLIRKDIEFESEKVLACAHNSTTNSIACSSPFRQVWLWIHAAAFSEGCEALRCASKEQDFSWSQQTHQVMQAICENNLESIDVEKHIAEIPQATEISPLDSSLSRQSMAETGISVSCIPLDGRLAKLEVIGSKAIQILQKILHPVSETLEASFQLKKCSVVEGSIETQLQKSYILEHAEHLPFGAILSLMVKDPRNLPKMEIEGVSAQPSTDQVDNVPQNEATGASTLIACPGKEKEIISSLWSEPEVNSVLLSGNKDLWDIQNVLNTPVEENLLCMQKHQKRMAYFCLHNTDSGLSTSENAESSNSCPILLLKDNCPSGSSLRWSVILPLSWVKAFWIPLVSHGAHAIGFREKQQIACNVGLPSFPFDFHDCMSYSISVAEEAAASDKKDELRPPSMRPLRVPVPPPWSSIGSFEEFPKVRDNQSKVGSRKVGPASFLEDSVEQDGSCLGGFVVRTSNVLSNYLNEVHGSHLLLFHNATEREKSFSEFSKDEGNPSRVPIGVHQILDDRKLSFLRVHLHAYKEGVFEEGAVVCAPRLSDISLWISRSDEQEGGLLIPQSSIGSYFVQLPCGKWELQKPEDPVARESYRFPIGFVTTGFVSGSTKPVAVAFCAATQLSRLRGEQWEGLQRKREQEIFVLVRNLRSAAYRLALATIVLEQQEEDIEFM